MAAALAASRGQEPLDLGELPSAVRTALAADAVAVVELGRGAPAIVATEGLVRDEALAVAAALTEPATRSAAADVHTVRVAGFGAVLYYEAVTGDGPAAAIVALRRDPGRFERTGVGAALAAHAAWALAVHDESGSISPIFDGSVDARLFAADTWEDLMAAITDAVERVTGAARAGVHVWDNDAGVLQLVPGSFGLDPETAASARVAPLDWWSGAARVFTTGQPYVANEAAADPGLLREYTTAFGIRRVAMFALRAGERCIGVVELADKASPFGVADVAAASRLAPRLAVAVEAAQTRFRLLRRNRQEAILGQVAVNIASGKSLQEFLATALDDFCDASDLALLAVVPQSGEPIVWRHGLVRPDLEKLVLGEANDGTGLRTRVVGAREPRDPGYAVLHVPIHLNGKPVATLSSLRTRSVPFDRDERQAMSRLASLTALAWATESYQRQQAQRARLAERERIADELHDHTAQLLVAARFSLEGVLEVAGIPDAAAAGVTRARDLIARSDVTIRQAIRQLAVGGDDGLLSRLAATVGGIEEEYGHAVQLEIATDAARMAQTLGPSRASLLTKVTREALVNAAKHAGPCQMAVRLRLTQRGRLFLTVSDDGIGIPGGRSVGYGLTSLRRAVRQHGGDLRVLTAATGGTQVSVSLPV